MYYLYLYLCKSSISKYSFETCFNQSDIVFEQHRDHGSIHYQRTGMRGALLTGNLVQYLEASIT